MAKHNTEVINLYVNGYTPAAIAFKTGLRVDKVTFILGHELLQNKLNAIQPTISYMAKLPKKILEQFPEFPQEGPYFVELNEDQLIIRTSNGK